MRRSLTATLLLACVPLLAGCASFTGKTKPSDRPDMAVPPPPPHVVPITPEPIIEPVADVPAAPSSTPAARPPRTARENPKPAATEAKPEAKPETPVPDTTPPPPVTPPAPAPQLRTAESGAAEAGVRASIEHTKNMLSGVDYRRLSTSRKKVYDDAKRFIQQAEDALKVGNAVFAQSIASKAEILAKDLSGR
jgi:hypothetical protein